MAGSMLQPSHFVVIGTLSDSLQVREFTAAVAAVVLIYDKDGRVEYW